MPKIKTIGKIHDTITGYDFRVDEPLTRAKAIRKKCMECQCGSREGVRLCAIYDCTLWPFRIGKGKTSDTEGRNIKTKATGRVSGGE